MVARKAYKVYCLKLLVILLFGELTPKKKRMRQLDEHLKKGREVKKNKQGISSVVGSLSDSGVSSHFRYWVQAIVACIILILILYLISIIIIIIIL